MRQLEAQVGERLFDRGKAGVRLTPAGRVLVPVARDLVGRSERAEALMRGLAQPDALTIRLLAPETTVADVIAPFLAQLASETPRLDVREALPAAIYPEVIAGAADIGDLIGPTATRAGDQAHRPLPDLGVCAADAPVGGPAHRPGRGSRS